MNRLVILGVALCMVWFGILNFQLGFASFRMPSLMIAWWVLAIPISGALISLFVVEQLVNGWRNGFARRPGADRSPSSSCRSLERRHEQRAHH